MKHGGDSFGNKKVRELVRVNCFKEAQIVFIFPRQVL